MTQTDPSPQKPDRPEEAISITLKSDRDKLYGTLQKVMAANPRQIDETGLDELIDNLTAINTEIRVLRRKEPEYFTAIEGRETIAEALQKEIRNAVNHLSSAAEALERGRDLKVKREKVYPEISGSIQSLRNALKQFKNLKIKDLSQTSYPLQQSDGPEKLQKDKDRLDDILNELDKNPRRIKESKKLDTYITDLLVMSMNAETFRNRVPMYFVSIDALQQNIRDAVNHLAMAADVLEEKDLYEKIEVFFQKIGDSVPFLENAFSQFQLPEMEGRSQKKEDIS
ncbi:MAG TPA: hypothetical protein VFV38_01475 [Ktedonobacteraceae bacterium]|nr:hypothetical protein [Ktedonobacteraceae bacterium]